MSHTRTSTDAGPDFCAECSAAVQEWIPWPCAGVCICDRGPNSDGPDEWCPVDGRRCTFNQDTTCAAIVDNPTGSGYCCRWYDQYEREVNRMTQAAEATGEAPCHWTHKHNRHQWTPLIQDPEANRVLHVGPPIWCPGKDDFGRPVSGSTD